MRDRLLLSCRTSVSADVLAFDYSDEQERDDHGRWSVTGASAVVSGKGKERTVTFVDKNGKALPKSQQDRLHALVVPPGWTQIRLSKDPNASLQAQGKDKKGQWQPKYSAKHTEAAKKEKFARQNEFMKAVPIIDKKVAADTKKGNPTAAAARAIMLTGFRPGSDKSAAAIFEHKKDGVTVQDKGHYGITTITGKHIEVKGDQVKFSFPGKHGQLNEKTVKDSALANYLRDKAGSKEKLFSTNGNKIGAYLKSVTGNKEFKTKDFRTYQGTAKAIELVGTRVAKSEPEFKAIQREVAKGVAAHLCNIPAVALESYISPFVWDRVRKFK